MLELEERIRQQGTVKPGNVLPTTREPHWRSCGAIGAAFPNGRPQMLELEERIRQQGTVKPGNVLKVDALLNHQ